MNKKIKTGFLCSLLCSVSLVAAGIGIYGMNNSNASAETEWSGVQVTEEYFLGAEFELPDGKLTIGDKTVDASVSLVYPDGSATRAEYVTLDQVGTYVLKYSATVDGKPYGKEVSFDVRGDIITHIYEDTKIGYQTCEYASDPEKEYLTVALAQNDKITFSQLIDVENITKSDTLVDMFFSPSSVGVSDFDQFYYQLTDAENPDIYLKVRMNRYAAWSGQMYFLSGGNGQELKGYEKGLNKIHVNNSYGTPFANVSIDAKDRTGSRINADEYGVSLRYNAASREVYVSERGGSPSFVMDMDSTKFFQTLWTGFPSGKVSLSMWAENYNSATATFCITKVRGIDLSAYGNKFVENDPPVITVDNEYETMPEAKVGMTYPVPAATAYDTYSGACDVDVAVWYNYASSNALLVDVVDGRFAVERKGYYTIVYTARDRYNNVATTALNVHAGNVIDDIKIELLTTPENEVTLGAWTNVPTDWSITGGSGEKTVTIVASNGTDSYEITDGFRPETAGEWTITYVATDYVGSTGEHSYTVDTVVPEEPTLVDELAAPMMLIAGSPYTVPELYANDYRSGVLVKALCEAEITDANGTVTKACGESFTPTVGANGDKVTLTYKYDGYTLASVEIPTIFAFEKEENATRLQEQNYFYGEGFTNEKTGDGIIITSTAAESGWTFANALVSEGFEIVLANEVCTYEGFELTLTDVADHNNVISMQLIKNGEVSVFRATGTDGEWEIQYDLSTVSEETIKLGFKDNCFTANGTPLEALKTVSGEAFEGFAEAKAYVSLRLINAEVGSAYRVVSINGNPFTGNTRDQIAPTITILGDYGGTYGLNATYTITAAVASDVLSPNVSFSMTVKDPNGEIAKDVNGVELKDVDPTVTYDLVLSVYGQYSIVYTAQEDTSFTPRVNVYNFYTGVSVVDMEAPEITFDGDFQTSVKVGEALVIPDFTVSDNVSNENGITVSKFVLTSQGALILLKDNSNSILPMYAGVYEFRIVLTDEAGNMVMIRAQVTVTE